MGASQQETNNSTLQYKGEISWLADGGQSPATHCHSLTGITETPADSQTGVRVPAKASVLLLACFFTSLSCFSS
jgi:hypothetical protein